MHILLVFVSVPYLSETPYSGCFEYFGQICNLKRSWGIEGKEVPSTQETRQVNTEVFIHTNLFLDSVKAFYMVPGSISHSPVWAKKQTTPLDIIILK